MTKLIFENGDFGPGTFPLGPDYGKHPYFLVSGAMFWGALLLFFLILGAILLFIVIGKKMMDSPEGQALYNKIQEGQFWNKLMLQMYSRAL